jgi:hypothetical protein
MMPQTPIDSMDIPNPPPLEPAPRKTNWLIFFGLLLAPAVLALLAASAKADGLAIACLLVGGSLAGITCGTMLAKKMGRTHGNKILLGVMFAVLLGSLSFGLGFAGCMLGGFKMDFR